MSLTSQICLVENCYADATEGLVCEEHKDQDPYEHGVQDGIERAAKFVGEQAIGILAENMLLTKEGQKAFRVMLLLIAEEMREL